MTFSWPLSCLCIFIKPCLRANNFWSRHETWNKPQFQLFRPEQSILLITKNFILRTWSTFSLKEMLQLNRAHKKQWTIINTYIPSYNGYVCTELTFSVQNAKCSWFRKTSNIIQDWCVKFCTMVDKTKVQIFYNLHSIWKPTLFRRYVLFVADHLIGIIVSGFQSLELEPH